MAAGIVSYGTYVPNYRLPREVMAKEWGIASLGGERTVANYDEDSLTLAVNAAVDAFGDRNPQSLAGVFFASTTSPYREKQAAVTVATVLDAGAEIRTIDFTDTLARRDLSAADCAGFSAAWQEHSRLFW